MNEQTDGFVVNMILIYNGIINGIRRDHTMKVSLLPFNGSRWFGADIVHHPIYSLYLVDDVIRHLGQKTIGQLRPVSSHAIG